MTGYIVQSAQSIGTSAANAGGTVTLPAATRAGNTLVTVAMIANATTNGSVSAVTLGGSADNFGLAFAAPALNANLYWWLDPLCAGGQTAVAATVAAGSGAQITSLSVLEVGGMIPIPANRGLDVGTVTVAGTNSVFNSGTTAQTGWPTELWVGAVAASGLPTITGSGYPWVTLAPQGTTVSGLSRETMVGYEVRPTEGNASFSGTMSTSLFSAGVATFPALVSAPSLPDYMAGFGPQQGDMNTLVTSPLSFCQERVVFRAAQLTTTTTLASGPGTASSIVGYDTVFEDPYQGWNAAGHYWVMPFTGVYQATFTVSVGTCPADTILNAGGLPLDPVHNINSGLPDAGLVMPSTGGIIQGAQYYVGAAGVGTIGIRAVVLSSSNVTTSNSPGSTLEIHWVGFSPA